MRKWGSFMGAGLAFALMKASDNNYRAIFLLAAGAVNGLRVRVSNCSVQCKGPACSVALGIDAQGLVVGSMLTRQYLPNVLCWHHVVLSRVHYWHCL